MDIRDTEIQKYMPPALDNKELLSIFPEAEDIISQKIAEYSEQRRELISAMKRFYQSVQIIAVENKFDEFFVWFWGHAYLKYFYAPLIVKIDKTLWRLYRQERFFTKNEDNNHELAWEELKERAKGQALDEIALPYLEKVRQMGGRLIARCPFHKEKNPSFNIYLNQNSYHCFGCQDHGDTITFYMKINNLSFKDAVKELAK